MGYWGNNWIMIINPSPQFWSLKWCPPLFENMTLAGPGMFGSDQLRCQLVIWGFLHGAFPTAEQRQSKAHVPAGRLPACHLLWSWSWAKVMGPGKVTWGSSRLVGENIWEITNFQSWKVKYAMALIYYRYTRTFFKVDFDMKVGDFPYIFSKKSRWDFLLEGWSLDWSQTLQCHWSPWSPRPSNARQAGLQRDFRLTVTCDQRERCDFYNRVHIWYIYIYT